MTKEYEWDIYEVFKEQIEDSLPTIQSDIYKLREPEHSNESINSLFRTFHNFKATADYLSLTPLKTISHRAETVLSSLRGNSKIVEESIVEWIFNIKEQLEIWLEQMDKHVTDLQDIPKHLNIKIKISKSYMTPAEKLKSLSLIYIKESSHKDDAVIDYLKKILKDVKTSSFEEYKNMVSKYDIIISDLGRDNYIIIDYINKNYSHIPVLPIFEKISSNTIKNLIKFNTSHFISGKISEEKLKRELHFIVKIFFSSKNILFNNKKINSYIKTLKPLSKTIFDVVNICDDEEASINDLINVVKKDPIITATILKYATSPLYGTTTITTIDKAITRLGKRIVKALTLSDSYKNIPSVNLNPYNITEDSFSMVSMTRLSLMLKWFSKVNIADLSILSSTAILSNIGQLLISKEILEINQDKEFKRVSDEFDINYAEEAVVHTTTTIVTAQILNHWNLSKDIIDVITYSDRPLQAPEHLKNLAVANHIVTRLIDLQCNILKEIPEDIISLLKECELNIKPLQKALDSINNESI